MKYFPFLLTAIIFMSCQQKSSKSDSGVDTVRIASHIIELSDDSYLGRKPFTEGETKTINYLRQEFESMGLEPGNGDSYFQEVPLVQISGTPSENMVVSASNGEVKLERGSEFVAYTEQVVDEVSLEQSELVFAGYGVVAPEYGWNDYEGLDVKGKTVIVLVNDPGFEKGDESFFKGETMTYYGRWTYKYEEAARQGAAGVFIIHETVPAGYPWAVVSNSWSRGRLNLDNSGSDEYQCAIQGWITRDAAIKIFELSSVDMRSFKAMAQNADFKPQPLGVNANLKLTNEIKRDKSYNVAARITGSSSPDEVIIYSAHWDHLGVGTPVDGDSIYNGAHDNASGTAMMMGIAEAMAKMERPERTVLFLAVTAEEQGLLGSKYYASNPIYDVDKTVANLNIDGVAAFGKMKDFTVIGKGQSELEEMAEKYVLEQGRYIYPDPDPGKGYFFRSDHFSFAKVGIPALYASGAYEAEVGGVDRIKAEDEEYLTYRYHKPADEYNNGWQFGGVYQDAEIYLKLGSELANSDVFPKWKEGSEFKAIREN